MKNQKETLTSKEMTEMLDLIKNLKKQGQKAQTLEKKEQILNKLNQVRDKLDTEYQEAIKKIDSHAILGLTSLYADQVDKFADTANSAVEAVQKSIDKMNRSNGKVTFIGGFFTRKAKTEKKTKEQRRIEREEKRSQEEKEYELYLRNGEARKIPKAVKVAGCVLVPTAVVGLVICTYAYAKNKAAKEAEKALEQQLLEELTKAKEDFYGKVDAINKARAKEVEGTKEESKEEKILGIVKELTETFNQYEGLNVTEEQVLALFIHLNVANSFLNENAIALDKITRESLIKTYYVGLEPGTEEFAKYEITDDDLAKVTTAVLELRNACANRVIVLNDEGKYAESREIIALVAGLITDGTLTDEANTLIASIQNMQTDDFEDIKREAYLYYNYIFAGPKSNVRNFDDYGSYKDGDGKIMTYENQGATIRFLTWYLDIFVGAQISGKNIIPQDIINSKEAKLMDHANLMRMLGYKNCGADMFAFYYGIDFDKAIDNKKTGSSKSVKESKSTNSNIANATGNALLDQEIDAALKQNAAVGSTYITSEGYTFTVTESGKSSTTIVIDGGGNSVTADDPAVNSGTTTTIEGGGNETTQEIDFGGSGSYEETIQAGGDVISNNTTSGGNSEGDAATQEAIAKAEAAQQAVSQTNEETREEITFEEENNVETYSSDSASIKREINQLLLFKQVILGQKIVPGAIVTIDEDNYQKTLSC